MVIPLLQTSMTNRGVMENAPPPTSLLLIWNPAKTVGLSSPDSPENGDR